jgi:hypothetical protein
MKEFMFLIRKDKEDLVSKEFLKACENYINRLMVDGRLISAKPMEKEDNIVLSKNKTWKVVPAKEIIGGYYHILAKDLEEAISIAKDNPEFEYHPDAKIEVRPLKGREESTSYIYPGSAVEDISYIDEIEIPF